MTYTFSVNLLRTFEEPAQVIEVEDFDVEDTIGTDLSVKDEEVIDVKTEENNFEFVEEEVSNNIIFVTVTTEEKVKEAVREALSLSI